MRPAGGHGQRASALRHLGRRRASPHLLLGLAVLFWAGNFVVGRAAHEVVPPIAFNFWRWTGALLVLLPFAWLELRRHRMLVLGEWRSLAALGACGITVFHSAVYLGLGDAEAINGALYFATSPVFFVLLARLLLGERIGGARALGIVASIGGALLVIGRGDPRILLGLEFAPGDLWLVLSVAFWALYSVLLKRRPPALPPLALLAAIVGYGLVLLLPLYAAELWSGRSVQIGPKSLASLAYVALFPSVIAYVFWNRGVREVGPSVAGLFMPLLPVFGAALAIPFLGERLAWYHCAGAALVVSGILLASGRAAVAADPPGPPRRS
jgi:drug/metabolite transporter (DMT)-like permease